LSGDDRTSVVTVCSIAIVAYALCDVVHEVLGHCTASLFSPSVHALSVCTIAVQSAGSSRVLSASGTIANVIAGVVALLLFRNGRGELTPWRYFLWLFGTINLLLAGGYPMYSAALNFGDWKVVIAGLQPQWLWRAGMGAFGFASYVAVIRISAALMSKDIDPGESTRLTIPAYIAGGLTLVAGAIPNPIGPRFILLSGASSGFGATVGLFFIRGMLERAPRRASPPLPFSRGWLAAAVITAALFVGVLGPGVRL
jgi:hypothetical protein